MNTLIKTIGALAIAGGVALGVAAPASAHPMWFPHHHYSHPYHQYYGPSYYGPGYYYDPGYDATAGFIGGIFGAIAGTAIHSAVTGGSHEWRCAHTYRSYVPATDSYTGYDGKTHLCRL